MKINMKKLFAPLFASALLCCSALSAEVDMEDVQTVSWNTTHSLLGECHLEFPCSPKLISEKKRDISEEMDTQYDAYVASPDDLSTYMLLITHYPDFVDETYAKIGLETFLNGVLNEDSSNELISASMKMVGPNEALDFLIKSGTQFFKGRAIIAKNKLYLMALEVEIPSYNETHFERFVTSFNLKEGTQ